VCKVLVLLLILFVCGWVIVAHKNDSPEGRLESLFRIKLAKIWMIRFRFPTDVFSKSPRRALESTQDKAAGACGCATQRSWLCVTRGCRCRRRMFLYSGLWIGKESVIVCNLANVCQGQRSCAALMYGCSATTIVETNFVCWGNSGAC